MPGMAVYLCIFIGGGLGALARYLMSTGIMDRMSGIMSGTHEHQFPWGTLAVNLLGALLIALIAEVLGNRAASPDWLRALLITGILGGFTTFSAFSLESANLLQRHEPLLLACYVAASVGGTIGIVLVVQKLLRAG